MTEEDRITAVLRQVAEGELGVDEAAALLADGDDAGVDDADADAVDSAGFGDPLAAAPFADLHRPPPLPRMPVPPRLPVPPVPPLAPRLAPRGRSSSRTDLLLALARMGVTRDWLAALRDTPLAETEPEVVVALAEAGVTPDWLRAAADVELDGPTIVALAERGVTPDWLRAAGDEAKATDAEALIGLADAGVTADVLPELLSLARR